MRGRSRRIILMMLLMGRRIGREMKRCERVVDGWIARWLDETSLDTSVPTS
jgi:hypothetical protein